MPLVRLPLVALLALGPTWARAGVLNVPGDQPTIQDAIDNALPGDTIVIAAGTYLEDFNIGQSLTLVGSGRETTVIRASGSPAVHVTSGLVHIADLTVDGLGTEIAFEVDGADLVLRSVRAVNGDGGGSSGGSIVRLHGARVAIVDSELSAGMGNEGGLLHVHRAAHATLVRSTLTSGTAQAGGIAAVEESELWSTHSTWSNGSATDGGGGAIWSLLSNIGLVQDTFTGHSSSSDVEGGGAIWAFESTVSLVDTDLSNNTSGPAGGGLVADFATVNVDGGAFSNNAASVGGAVACLSSDPEDEPLHCTIRHATFIGNASGRGGAIYFSGADTAVVERSLLCNNVAHSQPGDGFGGAVASRTSPLASFANLYLGNAADVRGGAIDLRQVGSSTHDAFVDNQADDGAGIRLGAATFTVTNGIFTGHGDGRAIDGSSATATIGTSLFFDNEGGNAFVPLPPGNVVADPLFASNDACGLAPFALQPGSPAIDTGTGTDADGSAADMGPNGQNDPTDNDSDGVPAQLDCNDADPSVGRPVLLFVDGDGDGVGDWFADSVGCPSEGLVAVTGDCDDGNPEIHTGHAEVCANGVDDDCDGIPDETPTSIYGYADADEDGLGDPDTPLSGCPTGEPWADNADDCDDTTASVGTATAWYTDADGDGFGTGTPTFACDAPAGTSAIDGDCNDSNRDANPDGTEICDPDDVDEDCNGLSEDNDPGVTGLLELTTDEDGDGWGDPDAPPTFACDAVGSGIIGDCDDQDPERYPTRAEIVDDGINQDCDGEDPTWTFSNGGNCGCQAAPGPASGALSLALLLFGVRPRR